MKYRVIDYQHNSDVETISADNDEAALNQAAIDTRGYREAIGVYCMEAGNEHWVGWTK